MTKKVMIAVGGTGGHVIPSVALAKQLFKREPGVSVMFVGGDLKNNRFFEHHHFLHESVECGPMSSKNPLKIMKSIKRILKGIWQSRSVIKRFKPDVIVGFGSYYTFPILLAAKLLKIPIILHEANSIPGKVNRLLSPYAVATGIHFPETASLLSGFSVEVGMPLREGYILGSVTKKFAKEYFFLKPDQFVLLVFGGSQGAKAINELVSNALCHHFERKEIVQILHFTGEAHDVKPLEEMYEKYGVKAFVKAFEPRMDMAWAAADAMISRAGASTIAEQLEFEVPGIYIPYPHSSENHQKKNAEFMVKTVGGAISFNEEELTPETLGKKIATFLSHDHILLRTMQDAMNNYKKSARSKDLCSLIMDN